MLRRYVFVLALVLASPFAALGAGYGDPCNDDSECPARPSTGKRYCYPGPTGGAYCLHGDYNCAMPGRTGVTYGYTHQTSTQVCTCVQGQGWRCRRTEKK